ncbi:MAG: hypothetical protein ACE5G3_03435 [Gammaproteobacteria bacterium]
MNERELTAFELGYDLAMRGRDVPEDASKALCDGYRTGRRQYPFPRKANRYIHKWLQIRLNALRRGKRVDTNITPGYLERIDLEHCPVTGERLTRSTGRGSDWSIDRCDNRRGYVPGNLVVMSTRANIAKSDLTFRQILANGQRDEPTEGLLPADWQRMALVVAPAERAALGEPPAQYLLGDRYVPGQPYGLPAQVQASILVGVLHDDEFPGLAECIMATYAIAHGHKQARRAFDRMMTDMFRRTTLQGRSWDYWALKRPLRLFIEFWVTLSPQMRNQVADKIGFVRPGVPADAEQPPMH